MDLILEAIDGNVWSNNDYDDHGDGDNVTGEKDK